MAAAGLILCLCQLWASAAVHAMEPELDEKPLPINEEDLVLADSEKNADWEKLADELEEAQPHPAFHFEGKVPLSPPCG